MKKLIVANWKLNAPNLKSWRPLRAPKNVEVVICPPFTHMSHVSRVMSHGVKLGAQNVFWEDKGAFTGEVSPGMLKNLNAEYVIVGHSERRRLFGEIDEMINKKVLAVLRAGLKVILCVGEPLAIRKRGLLAAKRFVANQLKKDLKGIHNSRFKIHNSLIVAYEPIWAIGTGRADRPEETAEMARFIKDFLYSKFHILNSKILYGGSVNSKNAKEFLTLSDVDGALVGGASLKVEEFRKIVNISAK